MQFKFIKKDADKILIILATVFTILFFAPLDIFFSNVDEIWVDVYDILPLIVGSFVIGMVLALAIYCILKIIKESSTNLLALVAFATLVILYIHGNFLLSSIRLLDGSEVNWKSVGPNLLSVVVILVVVCVIAFSYIKKRDKFFAIARTLCVLLVLLELFTLVTSAIMNNGLVKKDGLSFTRENEFTYSEDSNFTIIVLDQFDGKVMSEVVKDNSEYADVLDGFTFYPDTLSRYNLTACSLPQMISGKEYLREMDYDEYISEALVGSPLLNRLKAEDYSLNLYAYMDVEDDSTKMIFDNCNDVEIGVSSRRKLLQYVYELVGYRYLPYYFKQYCWFYSDDMLDLKMVKSVEGSQNFEGLEAENYNWDNWAFYQDIEQVSSTDKKMFHLIHMRGLHSPITRDRNFEISDNTNEYEAALGCMKMLGDYFNELKNQGLYDNSIIIVMGDHGSSPYGNNWGKHNPLLLIKGFNEQHSLAVSDKKVSYAGLNDIYNRLMDGDDSFEAVDSTDERRYIWITQDGIENEFVEYGLDGNAYNENDLFTTGVVD